MKKLITLIIITLSAISVNAQKGTWYLGTTGIAPFANARNVYDDYYGSRSYVMGPMTGCVFINFDNSTKIQAFGLAPEAGYFFTDKLAVGLGIFYTRTIYTPSFWDSRSTTNYASFGIDPYLRYSFLNLSKTFKMYAQLDMVYSCIWYSNSPSVEVTYLGIGIKPGISYNLNDHFAINASYGFLGYERESNSYSALGLNFNASSLSFGFTVSF